MVRVHPRAPEKEPTNNLEPWFEEAAARWNAMGRERQGLLMQIAEENKIDGAVKFTFTHKYSDFDKIPKEYQKILAKKLGLRETD